MCRLRVEGTPERERRASIALFSRATSCEQGLDHARIAERAVVAALERHGRGGLVAQPAEERGTAALDEILVADHVVGGQVACEAGEEPIEDEKLPSQALRLFVQGAPQRRVVGLRPRLKGRFTACREASSERGLRTRARHPKRSPRAGSGAEDTAG